MAGQELGAATRLDAEKTTAREGEDEARRAWETQNVRIQGAG